jgi:hypothetical protein
MDIKAAIPTLRSLVRHYMDNKPPHGSQTDTDEGYEVVLVGYAVQSLAQMHDTASKGLVSELLEYFQKSNAGEVEDIAEAALDLGLPEATVRKYLSSDDDMAHIQSLRYQEKTLHPAKL